MFHYPLSANLTSSAAWFRLGSAYWLYLGFSFLLLLLLLEAVLSLAKHDESEENVKRYRQRCKQNNQEQ